MHPLGLRRVLGRPSRLGKPRLSFCPTASAPRFSISLIQADIPGSFCEFCLSTFAPAKAFHHTRRRPPRLRSPWGGAWPPPPAGTPARLGAAIFRSPGADALSHVIRDTQNGPYHIESRQMRRMRRIILRGSRSCRLRPKADPGFVEPDVLRAPAGFGSGVAQVASRTCGI